MPATLPAKEILTLSGEIDLHRSPEVKEALGVLVQRQVPSILIDLSAVDYIDSSGLAVLIEGFQRVTAYGGKLGLFGLQEKVRGIFEVARLDQVFQIFPDEASALASV